MFKYILWLCIFTLLPTILMWLYCIDILKKYWKILLKCLIAALIFSIPWDIWAVSTNIWRFPKENILGIWIVGLPLEEYLFMILTTVMLSTAVLLIRIKFLKEGLK